MLWLDHGPHGLRTIDVEVSFSQNSGGVESGDGVAAKIEIILGAHLHDHFDGSELLIFIGNDANDCNVANIHASQPHGRALAQAACVVEVGDQSDSLIEETTGSGHQEKQEHQCETGENHRNANTKL